MKKEYIMLHGKEYESLDAYWEDFFIEDTPREELGECYIGCIEEDDTYRYYAVCNYDGNISENKFSHFEVVESGEDKLVIVDPIGSKYSTILSNYDDGSVENYEIKDFYININNENYLTVVTSDNLFNFIDFKTRKMIFTRGFENLPLNRIFNICNPHTKNIDKVIIFKNGNNKYMFMNIDDDIYEKEFNTLLEAESYLQTLEDFTNLRIADRKEKAEANKKFKEYRSLQKTNRALLDINVNMYR